MILVVAEVVILDWLIEIDAVVDYHYMIVAKYSSTMEDHWVFHCQNSSRKRT
jgi:hypothetical protein